MKEMPAKQAMRAGRSKGIDAESTADNRIVRPSRDGVGVDIR
jgi:hypothetical protein